MDMLRLAIGLMLPWILGGVWVRAAWPAGGAGAWAAILGYGYLIGVLVTVVVMVALDSLGIFLNFYVIAGILACLALPGIWLTSRVSWFRSPAVAPTQATPPHRITWGHAAAALLIALLVARFSGFALEIVWRPLYPWDAWMNWAPKARVWFEHGSLVPYVEPNVWLASVSPEVYTGSNWENWAYPPFVPLIQLWIALALGRWDESLINLPWLLCGLALVTAFYGQARGLGAQPLFAIFMSYLLASMPFVGTHIALAGYADLWIATIYGLGVMAFLRWADASDPRQAIIALLLITALPFVKQPGIFWAATFFPALLVTLHYGLRLSLLLVIATAALILLFFLILLYFTTGIEIPLSRVVYILVSPDQVILPGYSGEGLEFYPVWDPFLQNLLVLANWHLFWFLAPGLLLAAPFVRRDRHMATAATLILTGLIFLFVVFFFTKRYSAEALNYTTINRALLHLVPAMMFAVTAMLLHVLHRSPSQ